MQINQAPAMIEAAGDYIRAAEMLFDAGLAVPGYTNAAIGLEILFKSFTARPDGLAIEQRFRFDRKAVGVDDGHNLLELFDTIPAALQKRLGFETDQEWFANYFRTPFTAARYPYERGTPVGRSNAIALKAREMLDRVVAEYRAQGCDDPWILAYPNV